jgi:NADH-quinone oxidoreductase subunit L
MDTTNILLVPLLPLLSFVLMGLFGKSLFKARSGYAGTLLMAGSFLVACINAYSYFFTTGKVNGVYQQAIPFKVSWLEFGNGLSIDMGILLDPISVMMIVVVTLVSLMVHIYSLSYMKGEERYPAYYAFLGLFSFSMLGLVLASNLFQMYIFWELVGVSSFLLIGFYYSKSSALAAAKKAFIVTRFADLGFLVGILILSNQAGTLDFQILITRLTSEGPALSSASGAVFMGFSALSWGLALVFMGAAGKSAMFPLHIWLPDAMEGPTPVSALIHAATMVVAGVFLIARLFPVYAISAPDVLHFIGNVGAFSAIFAAIIACTQTDIKRVLAYSTMSQIGFMMFALGVSGYGGQEGLGFTASQFHLFTHALFKALLFLGAGVVIHHVHSNEIRDMGGLRKALPITHITFLIACLAISGIPPFAGFFSKEEILLAAYERNRAIYYVALLTSALTAFYMFRLYFTIFWWKPGYDSRHHEEDIHQHKTEDLFKMLPLAILAIGAVLAGFIPFGEYVSSDGKEVSTGVHLEFSIAPVLLAIAGILSAMYLFKKENNRPKDVSHGLGVIYTAAYKKFYIDEIYLFFTKNILFNLVARPAAWFDRNIIDGLVGGTGKVTGWVSENIKSMQSGKVQQYGMAFLAGIIIIVSVYLLAM